MKRKLVLKTAQGLLVGFATLYADTLPMVLICPAGDGDGERAFLLMKIEGLQPIYYEVEFDTLCHSTVKRSG